MDILCKRIGSEIEQASARTVSEIAEKLFGSEVPTHLLWLDTGHTLAIVHDANASGKAVNFFVETIVPCIPVQAIAGDVAFARFQPSKSSLEDKPVLEDLRPQDRKDIEELLSGENQVELSISYYLHGG